MSPQRCSSPAPAPVNMYLTQQKELCKCNDGKYQEMGGHLGTSAWAQCHHRGPSKWKKDALSINVRGVLKSPTIIVFLLSRPLISALYI